MEDYTSVCPNCKDRFNSNYQTVCPECGCEFDQEGEVFGFWRECKSCEKQSFMLNFDPNCPKCGGCYDL